MPSRMGEEVATISRPGTFPIRSCSSPVVVTNRTGVGMARGRLVGSRISVSASWNFEGARATFSGVEEEKALMDRRTVSAGREAELFAVEEAKQEDKGYSGRERKGVSVSL